MKTVDIIVPLLNEEKNIPLFHQTLLKTFETKSDNLKINVIFVDDGSKDNSWAAIQGIVKKHTNVAGIKFVRNFGKEYAVEAGLYKSTGDAAILIDADLQHPISLMPEMISAWMDGDAKVISAVKEKRQTENFVKKAVTEFYYWAFKKMSGLTLQNASDYKLIDRDVINVYLSLPETDRFFRGLIGWFGYKEQNISFTPNDREEGDSSWSYRQLYNYAKTSFVSFSYAPLHLIRLLSWLMFYFSLILGVQTLVKSFLGQSAEGFTTVILVQLIIGCTIMFSLSFMGTYIAKMYDALKQRPHYIVLEEI